MPSDEIVLVDDAGRTISVPEEQVAEYAARGYSPVAPEYETAMRVQGERLQDVAGTAEAFRAFGESAGDVVLLGGLSAAQRALGVDPAEMRARREEHDIATGLGTATGLALTLGAGTGAGAARGVLGWTPAGAVTRGAAGIASKGTAGAVVKAGAFEGVGFGAGVGLEQAALSDDPFWSEATASSITSNALLGGVVGVAGGAFVKAAEKGLLKGKELIASRRAAAAEASEVPEHLAGKNMSELRTALGEAEDGLKQRYIADEAAERVAVTDDLVAYSGAMQEARPYRSLLDVDDVAARAATKAKKVSIAEKEVSIAEKGLTRAQEAAKKQRAKADSLASRAKTKREQATARNATEKAEKAELAAEKKALTLEKAQTRAKAAADKKVGDLDPDAAKQFAELSARGYKARRSLRDALDTPKSAADNPLALRKALEKEGRFLGEMQRRRAEILEHLQKTGKANKAEEFLGQLDDLAARNEAIMARLDGLKALSKPTTSAEIVGIKAAMDALKAPKGLFQQTAELMGTSAITGAAWSIAGPAGIFAAPLAHAVSKLGAEGIKKLSNLVAGRANKVAEVQAGRLTKAAQAVGRGAKLLDRARTPTAVQALEQVRYGSGPELEADEPVAKRDRLAYAYEKRVNELANLLEPDGKGGLQVKMSVRQQIHERLEALRAVDPIQADRQESQAVARLEYLATKYARHPDPMALNIGPAPHRASEQEMREFALASYATENPIGVFEKAADGTVTPVEGEALRATVPEMVAAWREQVMEEAQRSGKSPTWEQALSISIITETPAHPMLHPTVLRQLQKNYTDDPGTQGGTEAPVPSPQFGSVRKSMPEPTPAQERGR